LNPSLPIYLYINILFKQKVLSQLLFTPGPASYTFTDRVKVSGDNPSPNFGLYTIFAVANIVWHVLQYRMVSGEH